MENKTVIVNFPGIDIKPGYNLFFDGLMEIISNEEISNDLGEKLRDYTYSFINKCDFIDFQEFSDTLYNRVHLGKDDKTGWEAIMMCWKKGNRTSIHGHPRFAAYNFAKGEFLVEVFKEENNGIVLTNAFEAKGGQGLFAVGENEAFDNHIHRITCLSDTGHSLHIYSDDARKGKTYDHLLNI